MKKIFILSSILLVVVLIFLGIYNFAFKKDIELVQSSGVSIKTEQTKDTLPVKLPKIVAISDSKVIAPVVDKKTEKIKYFDVSTGIIWEIGSDGQGKRQITETRINGLKSAIWSVDHNKVLTSSLNNGKTIFYMHDYVSQKDIALKDGLDNASWDNVGTKIFYKYFDSVSKKRTLNIADPDGSGWQKIADVTNRDIDISAVPLTSLVSYWNVPNSQEETQLQIVGATGGDPKVVLNGRYGADYLWSPKGDQAIVSSLVDKNSKTIMLGMVSLDGKYQDLNIPTFASKCTWTQDGKTIFYALPGNIPANSIMPDDYQQNKFNTSDTFWKMDVATGEKSRVVEVSDIGGSYDATNMLLSPTEDALYFINKVDQKIYKIQL